MKCDKYDKCTKTACGMCDEMTQPIKLDEKYPDLLVFDDQPKRQLENPDCHNDL